MTTDIFMGIAGIVIGIITTYVFHEIQKRRKELCWSIDSVTLIKGYSSLFEKLEIQYAGQKIENLTVSKLAFWNNGNETIDRAAIAIPPFIAPADDKTNQILDVTILATSTIGNQFKANKLENKPYIVLDFDYLDPQQGAVIQIIHTGVSIFPFMVGGEIKGVKDIAYKYKKRDFITQVPRLAIYIYGLITIVGSIGVYSYGTSIGKLSSFSLDNWFTWLTIITIILVALFAVFDIRYTKDIAKIPKDLLVFDKDDKGLKSNNFET